MLLVHCELSHGDRHSTRSGSLQRGAIGHRGGELVCKREFFSSAADEGVGAS